MKVSLTCASVVLTYRQNVPEVLERSGNFPRIFLISCIKTFYFIFLIKYLLSRRKIYCSAELKNRL
jgi:hypothetical protein